MCVRDNSSSGLVSFLCFDLPRRTSHLVAQEKQQRGRIFELPGSTASLG